MPKVEVLATAGGDHLLAGELEIELELEDGPATRAALALPPGAPGRPVSDGDLAVKLELCAGADADRIAELSWESAARWLRCELGG